MSKFQIHGTPVPGEPEITNALGWRGKAGGSPIPITVIQLQKAIGHHKPLHTNF